jgi:hypothetical protein
MITSLNKINLKNQQLKLVHLKLRVRIAITSSVPIKNENNSNLQHDNGLKLKDQNSYVK